jgi:hypothetical protein
MGIAEKKMRQKSGSRNQRYFTKKRLCGRAESDERPVYRRMLISQNHPVHQYSCYNTPRLFTQEFLYDQYVFSSITWQKADSNKSLMFDEVA